MIFIGIFLSTSHLSSGYFSAAVFVHVRKASNVTEFALAGDVEWVRALPFYDWLRAVPLGSTTQVSPVNDTFRRSKGSN